MGRKSRLKRERRAVRANASKAALTVDSQFERLSNDLKELFSHYSLEDVIVSLNVSDLWLPNISSQVKHALAFSISIAMTPDSYRDSERIKEYSDFEQFIGQVHALLPNFPIMEDYIPEDDWGEVKFSSKGTILRIFYGGAVERIPDFITAFNLIHESESQASSDMHCALQMQDHILNHIDRADAGNADGIETGHIEVPTKASWIKCREAIHSLSTREDCAGISQGLAIEIGDRPMPRSMSDFEEKVYNGTALPALLRIGKRCFPLALRNAAATVIEFWANKSNSVHPKAVADFLSARFREGITGPLKVVSRTDGQLPYVFSAVILDGAKPYLIIALEETELDCLTKLEVDLRKVISSGEWAFQLSGNRGMVQIGPPNESISSIDQLSVVAVLSRLSTVTGVLDLPRCNVKLLPLADFVTIFDAIEDIKELDRYWSFLDNHSSMMGLLCGQADSFAAFRDSHALLIDGAIQPSLIALDPHWGSTWRYKMLAEYWVNAPPVLPDLPNTSWKVDRDSDGLCTLTAKCVPALCWTAAIGNCTVHFLEVVREQEIELEDARILDVLVHCLADTLNQRRSIIYDLPIFKYRQIITKCNAKMDSLLSSADNNDQLSRPLFSNWHITENKTTGSVHAAVDINLQKVGKELSNITDASFEVAAATSWIEEISALLNIRVDQNILDAVRATSTRKPRFMMKEMERRYDVPDIAVPNIPSPEHYKIARRDLAIVFKDIGAEEGKYELAAAKKLIDPARDMFRELVHNKISKMCPIDLVQFCIEQLDTLLTKYHHEQIQTHMSLAHEVDYDRTKRLAKAHQEFVDTSRNYRYLLESVLSMQKTGTDEVTEEKVVQLVASIDWLMVLYNASDILHNGIDVSGLVLDHSYIPQVYYSEIGDDNDDPFANEAVEFMLGMGLNEADKIREIQKSDPEWEALNQAFIRDVGVSLGKLITSLLVLSRWPSAVDVIALNFSYSASQCEVRDALVSTVKDMTPEDADRVISLVSLNPNGIRRLLGKSTDEIDVPIWEHNKRGDRYAIKPLIRDEKGGLNWGAASMEKAASIWQHTLGNGYMPAEFEWPHIKSVVSKIKASLDKQLEEITGEILLHSTPYTTKGIDFMRRFPQEGFDDVGDFDGLAYWPGSNQWVTAECKYNQPAFCLKDARRLRDRIFGTSDNRKQFSKIERRREFLQKNMERIREILEWPLPSGSAKQIVHELYISRDIYWWMHHPPYSVPTHFIRVDGLNNWLRSHELLK